MLSTITYWATFAFALYGAWRVLSAVDAAAHALPRIAQALEDLVDLQECDHVDDEEPAEVVDADLEADADAFTRQFLAALRDPRTPPPIPSDAR